MKTILLTILTAAALSVPAESFCAKRHTEKLRLSALHRIDHHAALRTNIKYRSSNPTPIPAFSSLFPLLRLKLVIDQYNYDDIAIGFDSAATAMYDSQLDSRYFPGMEAPEGLSCLSADGICMSVGILPLPGQKPLNIPLDVEALKSGTLTLERTELDSIPRIFEIWLIDKYKKDSLDLRTNTSYKFEINKSDSSSFGSNRFCVTIRQNPLLAVHLLYFNAIKAAGGAQIDWTTENEENYTCFGVERSSDGGNNFRVLDKRASGGAGVYSFLDKTPPAVSDLYRLRITDLNGSVTYSNAITLIYGNGGSSTAGNINVYPNPAGSALNLTIIQGGTSPAVSTMPQSAGGPASLTARATNASASYNIKIVNAIGAIIKTASSSSPNWHYNIVKLPPGTYIITVRNSNDNQLVGKSTFVKL